MSKGQLRREVCQKAALCCRLGIALRGAYGGPWIDYLHPGREWDLKLGSWAPVGENQFSDSQSICTNLPSLLIILMLVQESSNPPPKGFRA